MYSFLSDSTTTSNYGMLVSTGLLIEKQHESKRGTAKVFSYLPEIFSLQKVTYFLNYKVAKIVLTKYIQ